MQEAQAVTHHFIDVAIDMVTQADTQPMTYEQCEALATRWGNEVRTDLLPEMLKNRAKVNATSKKLISSITRTASIGRMLASSRRRTRKHFLETEFEAKVAETFAEIHTFCAQHLALDLGVQGPSYDHDRFMAADEEAERANARRHATKIEADYEHERLQAALRYSMIAAKAAHLAFYQFMKPRAARQAPPL